MERSHSAESTWLAAQTGATEVLGRPRTGKGNRHRGARRHCCFSREAQSRWAVEGGQAARGEGADSDCPCWSWCL